MILTELDNIRYNVVDGDNVLRECASVLLAENFISTLSEEMQAKVNIVPVTTDGKQILMG